MQQIRNFFNNLSVVKTLKQNLNLGRKTVVSGSTFSETAICLSALNKGVYVAEDLVALAKIREQLEALGVSVFSIVSANSKAMTKDVIDALINFEKAENGIMLVLTNALFLSVLPKDALLGKSISLAKGQKIKIETLKERLLSAGFSFCEGLEIDGDFTAKGDTIDIMPPSTNDILRIEIAFDEVEEIKKLSRDTLSFEGSEQNIEIQPYFLQADEKAVSILSHFENLTILTAEPTVLFSQLETMREIFVDSDAETKIASVKTFLKNANVVFSVFEDFSYTGEKCHIKTLPVQRYIYDYPGLAKDLDFYFRTKKRALIMAGSDSAQGQLLNVLNDNHVFPSYLTNDMDSLNGLVICEKYLPYTAYFLEDNFVVIGTNSLIKKTATNTYALKKRAKVFYLPKVGDYVVHEFHGIGKCVALERMKLASSEKDYFVIEYQGGDKLYVPTEQANLISAYMGGEGTPSLNKIGGLDFFRQKEKVLKHIKDIAKDLISIYSARKDKKGFVFSEDGYLQEEFESAFPFEETPDQLSTIAEIKKDMTSGKIMDRLICGDVGFGKTEVALRAVYKAVQDGKQVAFLCPTTILSEQHYQTCLSRFKDFMVRVEVLNRFKTAKQQQEILERVKKGEVDVLIGTHAILSDAVRFADLGLLVLDEEHRFGVGAKEKIKKLRKEVDVISMSATPIPRTLHMSLSGIRDISVIATPPKERLPIQTHVAEFSFQLLIDAIKREFARGGQTLVVFNRVASIEKFASALQNELASQNIKVGIAHGQMAANTLEKAIFDLYNHKTDVMVATTLIENGVDLPRANTLFVVDSDRLGLSSLYQLRGRIGRSDQLAFAYFTYDGTKMLTPQAYKRLEALMQFTELGSGFKIALRDLEIRGAGNVLGSEQHGQMGKVGYDLYCKLLERGIKELQGSLDEEKTDVKITVSTSAFIDENYIQSEDMRIKAYTNISQIDSFKAMIEGLKELRDSFGEVPSETKTLCKIALIKNLASTYGIEKVFVSAQEMYMVVKDQEHAIQQEIAHKIQQFSTYSVLKYGQKPIINFELNHLNINEKLDFLISFLNRQ